jgi:hypothetical protein
VSIRADPCPKNLKIDRILYLKNKPFDRLTVLSEVEGLTTLSQVEGQYPNSKIQ